MFVSQRRLACCLFALVTLLPALSAGAQLRLPPSRPPDGATAQAEAQSPQAQTTIRVDVNLVSFPVTATDSHGRFVGTLRREDFRLLEDGIQQTVAVFHNEVMPVSMGIVVDTSGSMANKLPQAVDALEHFVRTIQPDDDVFLMRFSSAVQLMLDFTADRDLFSRAARRLRANGATRLYDALADALDKVRRGRHQKKALLLITDGEDTSSGINFQEVLDLARGSEVMVYCIGIGQRERGEGESRGGSTPQGRSGGGGPGGSRPGQGFPFPFPIPGIPGGRQPVPSGGGRAGSRVDLETVDMHVLEAIADATGGRAFHLQRVDRSGQDSIDATAQRISDELRHQYALGYYPSNSAHDGTYRRIELTTNLAEIYLRYRRGYYAPRGPSTASR
jgi:Ca-activated chloride channel family protein